ncbi:MAG: FAD-binding oxidoreductase [Desulfomonile tiedjei]|uniref:FAD-binding oxidoreductase n=1 Tax=Desulfomonile tiedjei TaxID=2358 RepID=A0A9D6UYV6_9BACT|nr:FAD-binding oxidoreductase [Desulfomonile tiedjei]
MKSSLQSMVSECRDKGISIHQTGFDDFLRDESRFRGHAEGLVRARSERDVVELLVSANRWRVPVTVVSGKTSLTGASVPSTGIVLDVRALDAVDPEDPSEAQPGINLKQYKNLVAGRGLFYPPDPTSEDSCTLGGNVATNASGALSYFYGPTRDYVLGMRLALPTGSVLEVNRDLVISSGGFFRISADLLIPRPQNDILVPVPHPDAPSWRRCKNSAGLFYADPMDLVDLFIGSEGILGVFLRIRTRLIPMRSAYFGLVMYMPDRHFTVKLVQFLEHLRQYFQESNRALEQEIREDLAVLSGDSTIDVDSLRSIVPSCMEWLGHSVASLLSPDRARKLGNYYGAIYLEQEYPSDGDPMEHATRWAVLIDAFNSTRFQGEIVTETALDQGQIRRLRQERQSIPEKLNELIRPGLVKIGMDFAVPLERLEDLLVLYESLPPGKSYSFGHIGNAHLHCNLIPDSLEEMETFREVYRDLSEKVCLMGGSVSGEHGIGKLKREALKMMIGSSAVERIRKIKFTLDPQMILNVGNMISVAEQS